MQYNLRTRRQTGAPEVVDENGVYFWCRQTEYARILIQRIRQLQSV
jgi:hypothetical protein